MRFHGRSCSRFSKTPTSIFTELAWYPFEKISKKIFPHQFPLRQFEKKNRQVSFLISLIIFLLVLSFEMPYTDQQKAKFVLKFAEEGYKYANFHQRIKREARNQ
jgi:hypothetical protein